MDSYINSDGLSDIDSNILFEINSDILPDIDDIDSDRLRFGALPSNFGFYNRSPWQGELRGS